MAFNTTFHAPKGCDQLVDQIVTNELEEGKDIEGDASLINLSVIMTNMVPGSIFTHLDFYLSKLIEHLNQDTRLRLLVLTDATFANPLRQHLKM